MDKFPSDNSSGEVFENATNPLSLSHLPLSGLLLSLWNDAAVRQLSDRICSLISSESFSEVCQSPISLLNRRSDSVGQELSAMSNFFNPASYLAKSDTAKRDPDLDTANRDLDSYPANISPDVSTPNRDKGSVKDVGDAKPISDVGEVYPRPAAFLDSARLEAMLSKLGRQLQQQADKIESIEYNLTQQAQSYQAQLDYRDKWYSAEVGRLRAYVAAETARAQGVYATGQGQAIAPQNTASTSAYSSTYKVPDRADSKWISGPLGGISPFLMLVVVGIVLTLLIGVAITPYGSSPGLLPTLIEMTKGLLPALAVVILIGGAIALVWELRR